QNNAIIGENVIGSNSNAIARIVTKSNNSVGVIYLNSQRFEIDEPVIFQESNINSKVDSIILGDYSDITNNFTLDKGQKEQYYDYSCIVRNNGVEEPSKRLLIVFDYYSTSSDDIGDVFTVLSYDEERFVSDIPLLRNNSIRSTDTLDFRPRVSVFTSTSSSPFSFSSRNFSNSIRFNLSPDENSIIGYSYYIGRIDKIYLDKSGDFKYLKGISSNNGKSAVTVQTDSSMELATISLPPYLYRTKDAVITLVDNKRYTMRDIGVIENRVKNLERVTSLSLLELSTQTLQIQDAQGLNRFKTGFFVDDFRNSSRLDTNISTVEIDPDLTELTPIISRNSLKNYLAPETNIPNEEIDLSQNYKLIDSNIQKTGEAITLKYESVSWISQLLATQVENVNPFNVISYNGSIKLSPSTDSWVRTIHLPDRSISVTNYVFLEKIEKEDIRLPTAYVIGVGPDEETLDIRTDVSYDLTFGSSTSSQTVFVRSEIEEYMRSRNTEFSISNLKPFTRFYQFLDGISEVDFIPKLIEISTDSTLQTYGSVGSFQVGESIIGYEFKDGLSIPLIKFRVASPDHKFGPFNSPSTKYKSNPYIRSESISSSYSSTSKILNVDTYSLVLVNFLDVFLLE
ncbi:MAG: DUF4815 domain-containing protein, partial [Minisyncoccia bacterium]